MQLTVQRIQAPEAFRQLADECDRIAAAMRPRLPFATSDWLRAWWQLFREERAMVRDSFYLHALRDERGALVALAPLMLTHRPSVGPLRVRTIAFWGGDKNITELRGLVCAPEHEGAATKALLAHLLAHAKQWDWCLWEGISAGSEAHAHLSEQPTFSWRRETVDHVLVLPRSWEEFRSTRSRNIKESLRKCYNSLKREGLDYDFRVVDSPAELPTALERCRELHALRAASTTLHEHADYLRNPAARGLLEALAKTPDRAPALRVLELRIGGELAASRLAFLLDDELYLYFSGFDPKWARFSVMTTTVAEAIKWAIERQLRVVNLSAGSDVSKTRWGPELSTSCSGVLLSPSRRSRFKWAAASELNRRSRQGCAFPWALDLLRRRG